MRNPVPHNSLTQAGLATTTGRFSEQTRLAVRCVAALLGVTTFGTVGFLIIEEQWGLWDCLYFTLITITTVGYGDLYPVTMTGRLIAAALMMAGIGLFGTFTGFVASWFVEVGEGKQKSALRAVQLELAEIRKLLECKP